MPEFRSFAALGDSFTEGVGDPEADGSGCRGWADRFAERLAARQPALRYANLAIRGKLAAEVLDEQVPAAIAMRPDLVSVAAGGNDLLWLRSDPDAVAETLEAAVAALTGVGATVMMFTGFDPSAFPVLRLIRGKSAVLSMHVRTIASRYDCLLVDLWSMRVLADRRMWCQDRLHLAPEGHCRVALLACEAAGVGVSEDCRAPLPSELSQPGLAPAKGWLTARRGDIEWITDHAGPWLGRRLRGVSTGDGRVAKRPDLIPVGVGVPAPAGPGVPELV
jgi:lysophospholipase L1-like esterase